MKRTVSQDFIVPNEIGLHARPAALLANTASQFDADVKVTCRKSRVNGKSIMGIMSLRAGQGEIVTVTADGHDAEPAVLGIAKLFRSFAQGLNRAPAYAERARVARGLAAVG